MALSYRIARLCLATSLACVCLVQSAHAEGAPLPDELRQRLVSEISDARKSGEKIKAWLTVLGEKGEHGIDGCDDNGISVLVQDNAFPVAWKSLSAADILSIARGAASGKGDRLLLAAELAIALNFADQASDILVQAAQADPSASEKIRALAQKLPAGVAPPPPSPAAPAHANSEPTPVAAPPSSGASLLTIPKRSGSPRKDRPRVLFDSARLAAVRARATNPDGKRFLTWLSKGSDDQELPCYGLAYVMSGDETFAKQAIDRADKLVAGGPIKAVSHFDELAAVAKIYDWCHDKIPDDKRKAWQTWMLKGFDNLKDEYMVGYHNYMMKAAWSFALAGYALEGDNPRAAELLQNAYEKRWRTKIFPACKGGLAGGAWAEGEGYGSTTASALLELAEAAHCAEGKDLFSEAPEFFAGRLAFEMFLDMPGVSDGGRRLWINGDMNRRRNYDDTLEQRLILQDVLRGSELAAYAEAYSESPAAPMRQYNSGNFMDVQWRDRTLPQKPLGTFKLSHHAWGRGTVLMRSDWTESATHVGFVAGPLITASHQHTDAGHFTIWKDDELASQAGDYRNSHDAYAANAYTRTIACNSLLIYDPSEKFEVRHMPGANDGGQLWPDVDENLNGARIIAYDARRDYTYICADLTPAYSAHKTSLVRRQFVYVRPGTIVVLDRVVSKNPDFQKVWQCYLCGSATQNGKSFATSNGKGRLKADVLLPADAKVSLVGGQDKAISVFGANFPIPPGKGDNGPAFRAEVRPGAARESDAFLVVLQAYDGAEPAAATFKDAGAQVKVGIPGGGELLLNLDGSPGGSYAGKSLSQSVLTQEE